MYEAPEHLVLHHNSVAENRLAGTLVGVITLKDPQLSLLSIKLLNGPAFEVSGLNRFLSFFYLINVLLRPFESEEVITFFS